MYICSTYCAGKIPFFFGVQDNIDFYGSMKLDLWHNANLAQIYLCIFDEQLIQVNILFYLEVESFLFCYMKSNFEKGNNLNVHIEQQLLLGVQ